MGLELPSEEEMKDPVEWQDPKNYSEKVVKMDEEAGRDALPSALGRFKVFNQPNGGLNRSNQ